VAGRSHLSIGEVLSLLQDEFPDVTISKIRFLESQGLVDPERTPSGYRKFYEEDIERLRWVLRQQRDAFLPLKVIKGRLEGQGSFPLDEPAPATPGTARGELQPNGGVADEVGAGQPGTGQPGTGQPGTGQPGTGQPGTGQPGTGQPGTGEAGRSARGRGGTRTAGGSTAGVPAAGVPAAGVPAAGVPAAGVPASDSPSTAASDLVPPSRAGAPVPGAGGGANGEVTSSAKTSAGADGIRGPEAAGHVAPASAVMAPPRAQGAAGRRRRTERGSGGQPAPVPGPATLAPAAEGDEEVQLSLDELLRTAGVVVETVQDLERYGLIAPKLMAGVPYYSREAAMVAGLAAAFARHGVEARHLRAYKGAAEREAGMVQQVVMPLIRQRNPEARRAASRAVEELSSLGAELRAVLLREALAELR
jgi:DNA-binding transcriptional MerR regulator